MAVAALVFVEVAVVVLVVVAAVEIVVVVVVVVAVVVVVNRNLIFQALQLLQKEHLLQQECLRKQLVCSWDFCSSRHE